MRGTMNVCAMRFPRRRLPRAGLLLAVVAAVALGAPSASFGAFQTGVGCHDAFQMPGFSIRSDTFDAVQVLRRGGMTCPQALYIAAKARWLKGIKVIYGKQFGAGGWGGPFHVGLWHCYVLNRGSDFINGKCWRGSRYVRFYDHRSDWRFPDPGFIRPTLDPNVQPVTKTQYEQKLGPLFNNDVDPALRSAPSNGDLTTAIRLVTEARDAMASIAPPNAVADLHGQAVTDLTALVNDLSRLRSAAQANDAGAYQTAAAAVQNDAQQIQTIGNQFVARGY